MSPTLTWTISEKTEINGSLPNQCSHTLYVPRSEDSDDFCCYGERWVRLFRESPRKNRVHCVLQNIGLIKVKNNRSNVPQCSGKGINCKKIERNGFSEF